MVLKRLDVAVERRSVDRLPERGAGIREIRAELLQLRLVGGFRHGLRAAAAPGEDEQAEANGNGERAGHGGRYPTDAGVRRDTALRSDPWNLIWLGPAKGANLEGSAQLGNHAGAGAAARARDLRHDAAVDEPRHLPAGARPAGLLRPLAPRRAGRDARRRRDRERDARGRCADRRGRARADDGAAARAARSPRLLPGDRPQRPAMSGLGGLRANRDRDRGWTPVRQALRLQVDLGLEA